jgi:hypothetical protein
VKKRKKKKHLLTAVDRQPASLDSPGVRESAKRYKRSLINIGDTVYHPVTQEPLAVIDVTDPGLLRVRDDQGRELPIGRDAVTLKIESQSLTISTINL